MTKPLSDLSTILRTLDPLLNDGVWIFASVPFDRPLDGLVPLATFREAEGMTVIVEESAAQADGLEPLFRCAWITLEVHSDLGAVGLTSAVAAALTEEGMSCNVVAAARHDHLFVPVEAASRAMKRLRRLQKDALLTTL
ncbi:MAG: ACT domain-containing protein [Thermoanaerobaculia bacterium]